MQDEQMRSEKDKAPMIIGGIIVIALVILGIIFITGQGEEKAMEEKKAALTEVAEKKDDAMEKKDNAMMKKAGSYEAYDASKLAMAKDGKVVLFFRASWCPSCRALDADIRKNLSNIPTGVTILDVDYDKYVDLKKQYGVTTQHTLVQVDANGKELGKWVGSANLAEIVSKLK